MIAHLGIPRDCAHNFAIHAAADVPDVFAHDAAGHDDRDARDGGFDAFNVGVGQAVLEDETLAASIGDLLFFGRLDAAEDDVLAAEVFDLFLRFKARPFANGEHGDDRADAEHNAENREQRTQLVQPEALDHQSHHAIEPGQVKTNTPGDERG